MATSVGFIGVGNMGNPMAANVLKAGSPLTVFDLNPKAMENLVEAGAKAAGSAREVVEGSEVVLTSLPASPDVERAYLEPGGSSSGPDPERSSSISAACCRPPRARSSRWPRRRASGFSKRR